MRVADHDNHMHVVRHHNVGVDPDAPMVLRDCDQAVARSLTDGGQYDRVVDDLSKKARASTRASRGEVQAA